MNGESSPAAGKSDGEYIDCDTCAAALSPKIAVDCVSSKHSRCERNAAHTIRVPSFPFPFQAEQAS